MTRRVLVLSEAGPCAREAVEAAGLEVVARDPELVLCHGGDGTLLRGERFFPGVPKLPVRIGSHDHLCPRHTLPAVLERLVAGQLPEEDLALLELHVGNARFFALNDVVLRNDNPALAVRFRLVVDGERSPVHTGDGLVVTTPFGSTGYYRSVTRESIDDGIAIGFNNSTRPLPPRHLPDGSRVAVEVLRGPAVLVHDNDSRVILLREGHRFEVWRADRRAKVLGLDALRCQVCRRADDGAFNPH